MGIIFDIFWQFYNYLQVDLCELVKKHLKCQN